ncbi:hypothetical protein LCGC14_2332650, partial [marine sediment metagenome]
MAQHHNELKDAIIILEEFVGVSGSENFVPKDEFGNVIVTGTLIVTEDVTFSGGLETGDTLVTGTLAVCSGADFKADFTVSGTITAPSGIFADTLTVSGVPVMTSAAGVPDPLNLGTINASTSLTISGVPVSTGTGGGASTLQDAYDGGDGTISTAGGKPFELTGTGELTAVTGTFTSGLTVGVSTDIRNESITTGSGIFDELFVGGQPVPPPSLEITANTTLTSTDTYVIVDGPAGDSGGPGFVADGFSMRHGDSSETNMTSATQNDGLADAWTWMGWVRTTQVAGNRGVFKFNIASGNRNSIFINFNGADSGDPFQVEIHQKLGGVNEKIYLWGQGVLNTWTQIAVTWDGSSLLVYQDGIEDTSPTKSVDESVTMDGVDDRFARTG